MINPVLIEQEELNRLKRLDENVKRKISEFSECKDGRFSSYYLSVIELLEGLGK